MSQAAMTSPIEEIVAFFARGPSSDEIATFRLSDAAQDHIRELLGKNAAGTLTHTEGRELDKVMVLNDVISLIRVRAQETSADAHNAAPAARTGT